MDMDINTLYTQQNNGIPLYQSALRAMAGTHCPVFYSKKEAMVALDEETKSNLTHIQNFASRLKEFAEERSLSDISHLISGIKWIFVHLPRRVDDFTPSAVLEIGKLSPDLRWAAAWRPFMFKEGNIDASDLDWDVVSMTEHARNTNNVRMYLALAEPKIATSAVFGYARPTEVIVKYITPHFNQLSYFKSRRIFLGESPVQLSNGRLTRREAHQWCLDGAPGDIARWLADYYQLPKHYSLKVIRWLQYYRESGRWHLLERPRKIRIAGQYRPRICSLLSILDKIEEADIITGRDSVASVIDRITERIKRMWQKEQAIQNQPLAPVPSWAEHLPREIRLLNSAPELIAESNNMSHCAQDYVGAVRRGECYIFSISTCDGRSTAELSPDLKIVQHVGFCNGNPPARNKRILRSFIKRIKNGGK